MTFLYTVHREGRKVSVAAIGELDFTAAGPFGAALCQLAESAPTDRIVVDLGGLRFIDSTGIAALNRAYRSTHRYDCVLVATNPTGLVRRVLELTGALAHLSPHLARQADADTHRA
jgi:anti-anti-sigma factor